MKVKIELPPKLIPVFTGPARYRCAYGGRGSGKTRGFALMSAVRAYMFAEAGVSGTILCAREFMNSLEDSSMEEIKQAIRDTPFLDAYFELGERFIRTRNRRVDYTFCGLRHNLDSIKSKARILIAWVDEAEGVSETAWQKLLPTVREEGSEVWCSWNPELDGSPVDLRFRRNQPPESKVVELNYTDNPWFPAVLELERKADYDRLDPQTYAWVWEGAYRENSDAQVFANKYRIAEFEPGADWDGPYDGLDFGFAQDPTAAVRCWIHADCLWIEREAGQVGLELDDTAAFIGERIPSFGKHKVRADSARPESISFLRRHGVPNIEAVDKWPGSVEDGISHMRSYREIVIHARCKETQREFRLYSYKVDRLTGDVLTKVMDAFNHYVDAIRYALGGIIQGRGKMRINKAALALASQRRR
ncbi:terminase large subunit [Pseudomonas phage Amjad_SA]|nr:terminase large subunit [Pseudomonas phage Amjad_SA]